MFNINETAQWEATIQEMDTTDVLLGGQTGELTQSAQKLANRTAWLKSQVEALGNDKSNLSDFANGLAVAGYQKLPGGLILQWQSVSVTQLSIINFAFPISFPTACIHTVGSASGTTGLDDGDNFCAVVPLSISQGTIRSYYKHSGIPYTVISIGY